METVHQTHVHVISVSHMFTGEVMMLLYGTEFLLISASVSLSASISHRSVIIASTLCSEFFQPLAGSHITYTISGEQSRG